MTKLDLQSNRFVRNAWYVAATSEELSAKPLKRTLLNEEIVLCRNDDGICQTVQPYPIVERYKWIWLWMGEAKKANEFLIPDFHWNDDAEWEAFGEYMHMAGNYQLLIDNLLELSHLGYLHKRTIGTVESAEDTILSVARTAGGVALERVMLDQPPPPMWRKTRNIKGLVDRKQRMEFVPPGGVIITTAGAAAGTVAKENLDAHVNQAILNFITPETETSLHYFWRSARNYAIDNKEISSFALDQMRLTFDEDKMMIEGQQRNLSIDRYPHMVDINADAGALEARRIMTQLLTTESSAVAAE